MNLFLIGTGLILAGGLAALVVPDKLKGRIYVLLAAAGSAPVLYASLRLLLRGGSERLTLHVSHAVGGIPLVLDPLSAFFALAIAVTCLLGAVYGLGYLKPAAGHAPAGGAHWFFLGALTASMLLVTVVQHALAFLVVWELMSLASFFLVVTEHEKEEVVEAGYNYLIAMHVGVVCLIAGFLAVGQRAGGLDFGLFAAAFRAPGFPAAGIFLLLFAGFGIKAGFIPLHTWLPRAHPAAPSHVSGIMSGIMIKTGIYGILRVPDLAGHAVGGAVPGGARHRRRLGGAGRRLRHRPARPQAPAGLPQRGEHRHHRPGHRHRHARAWPTACP